VDLVHVANLDAPSDRPVGIRLIVAYKLVRGAVALALAITLAVAALRDGATWLREFADRLREHFTGMWSMHLADLLMRAASRRSLAIGSAALGVDGTFTLFEAWALRRGFRWAAWLVIVATSSLLPFEAYELSRGVHAGRLAIFVANAGVVLYLVRRRIAEARAHALRRPTVTKSPPS
jgi:uncharacterized membrane protein (DUF2068 family)